MCIKPIICSLECPKHDLKVMRRGLQNGAVHSRIARGCQELPGVDIPGLSGVARGCQEFPGCARSCQKCQGLSGVRVCLQWIWIPDRNFIVQEMNLEGNGTMTGWDSHSLSHQELSPLSVDPFTETREPGAFFNQ